VALFFVFCQDNVFLIALFSRRSCLYLVLHGCPSALKIFGFFNVPTLTEGGQLSIRYRLRDEAKELLASVQEPCEKF